MLSPEEQLSGDMLMLTTGFMMCAAMLWLAIYWSMGYQYSTAIPLIFQGLSAGTISSAPVQPLASNGQLFASAGGQLSYLTSVGSLSRLLADTP